MSEHKVCDVMHLSMLQESDTNSYASVGMDNKDLSQQKMVSDLLTQPHVRWML